MKYLVYGDLSGHMAPYRNSLVERGLNLNTMILPPDVTVIQVGDLIDKGSDGDELIEFTYRGILKNGRSRWVQLIGNHEAAYLGGPGFSGGGHYGISGDSIATLNEMLFRRMIKVATYVPSATGDITKAGSYIVTHGGVTHDMWRRCGYPRSPHDLVDKLNDMSFKEIMAPGWMLAGEESDYGVGPIWAECSTEVYPSWKHPVCPFNQIHGHSSPMNWNSKKAKFENVESLDSRKTRTIINGKEFWGIDPCVGQYAPSFNYSPLVIEKGVVTFPETNSVG